VKMGRAWAIKESLGDLWEYRRKGWALRHWRHWYFWATHSQLPPVVKVARMIHGHLENVLTYFDHRITNATSEGLNSKIQTIKKTWLANLPEVEGFPGEFAGRSWELFGLARRHRRKTNGVQASLLPLKKTLMASGIGGI